MKSLKILMMVMLLCGAEKVNAHPEDQLISQLIINQTMTRLGQSFYRKFSLEFQALGSIKHQGISVRERPTASSGSFIEILNNRKIIFRTQVSPASKNIDHKAKQVAGAVFDFLQSQNKQSQWQHLLEPDLGRDEI
ncbi:CsgE family curli-type amyloid fiber assembly protein [Paraferrimonas sp. SM1919]|uniref:CsgE family curli-type amyloid fiber assembly protein n=1 Tax=Paraferrimonas sp. SM1919 TaxID=2662263 RepID=UPI0013D4E57B|nr:CsgE family curli-type amyloid fiber assembly protein [Paraferrimonas sp. SM1919]